MKSLVAAMGALALATGVAQAEPLKHRPAQAVTAQSYDVAGRAVRQDQLPTSKQAPNQGAGTSRSSDANQG